MLESLLSTVLRRVNEVGTHSLESLASMRGGASNALFDAFPKLADRIPWRPIGAFPTPVEELAPEGASTVMVKRDDLTCLLYGGNKVRKLEFLLADAALGNRRTLITMGGVGSNHALATAIQGKRLGFEVDLVLYDQPPGPFVTRNLGGFLATGARLHYAGTTARAFLAARRLFRRRQREGRAPYFVMVGGTCRLGCLGYVNASLELARQIDDGLLSEPEVLFVPLGTTGTAAGLLAGLRIAGLRTRVAAVRVADPVAANAAVLLHFARDAVRFLRSVDPAVPDVHFGSADIDVVTDQFGPGYGHPTPAALAAIQRVEHRLRLETTYTGKALAGCLDRCRDGADPSRVLFWNTFSSTAAPQPDSWDGLTDELRYFVRSDC